MINKQNFPLKQLKDTAQTFNSVREQAKKNRELYRIEKDEYFEIHLRGLGANSNFTFKISEPIFDNKSLTLGFTVTFNPINENKLDTNRSSVGSGYILTVLKNWTAILQRYLSISLHPSDNIEQQYENEFRDNFEDWFEIVDEDADITTYNSEVQLVISNVITKCIDTLKLEGYDEDDETVKQANYIKENITNLTKRQVFNALKTFYAKVKLKKNGLLLIKKIYGVVKEEALKMGVKYSIESVLHKINPLIEGIF
ncbi:hypothetical protein [Cellulophaga sp. Asnod2-G02]|uniref:hypothetical protein n=1 Tax=Cellulophaga sp. Asnod2-G02 TaxID=3160572 RepID=UPI0038661092